MKIKIILLALVLLIPLAFAQPVIHQVLYDAESTDTGKEFIEIYAPDEIDLEAYALYTSSGDSWELTWNGSSCIICSMKDYISFGSDNTTYPIPLTLQNTKGAVQLRRGNEVIDTIGYGEISVAYAEMQPANDVTSGKSLLRIADTNNNFEDFIASNPEIHSDPVVTFEIENDVPEILSYEGNTLFVEDENGLADIVFININNEVYEIECDDVCVSEYELTGDIFVIDRQGAQSNTIVVETSSFEIQSITQAIAKPGKNAEIRIDVKKAGSGNITLEITLDSLISKQHEIVVNQTTRHVLSAVNQSIMLAVSVPRGTAAGTYMGRITILEAVDT